MFDTTCAGFPVVAIVTLSLLLLLCPSSCLSIGFIGLPPLYLVAVGVIVLFYIITTEIVKKIFYKRIKF
jgi:TM2 domain-containing membrane protein YozV